MEVIQSWKRRRLAEECTWSSNEAGVKVSEPQSNGFVQRGLIPSIMILLDYAWMGLSAGVVALILRTGILEHDTTSLNESSTTTLTAWDDIWTCALKSVFSLRPLWVSRGVPFLADVARRITFLSGGSDTNANLCLFLRVLYNRLPGQLAEELLSSKHEPGCPFYAVRGGRLGSGGIGSSDLRGARCDLGGARCELGGAYYAQSGFNPQGTPSGRPGSAFYETGDFGSEGAFTELGARPLTDAWNNRPLSPLAAQCAATGGPPEPLSLSSNRIVPSRSKWLPNWAKRSSSSKEVISPSPSLRRKLTTAPSGIRSIEQNGQSTTTVISESPPRSRGGGQDFAVTTPVRSDGVNSGGRSSEHSELTCRGSSCTGSAVSCVEDLVGGYAGLGRCSNGQQGRPSELMRAKHLIVQAYWKAAMVLVWVSNHLARVFYGFVLKPIASLWALETYRMVALAFWLGSKLLHCGSAEVYFTPQDTRVPRPSRNLREDWREWSQCGEMFLSFLGLAIISPGLFIGSLARGLHHPMPQPEAVPEECICSVGAAHSANLVQLSLLEIQYVVLLRVIELCGLRALPPPLRPIFVSFHSRALAARVFVDGVIDGSQFPAQQLVILGAGYDVNGIRTAPQRRLKGIWVFEVDLPHVQKKKLDHLRKFHLAPPYGTVDDTQLINYVPCDFAVEDMRSALIAAGLDSSRPTAILWEGVSYYLSAEAVKSTLRVLKETFPPAADGPRAQLLMDYMDARCTLGIASHNYCGVISVSTSSKGPTVWEAIRNEMYSDYNRERPSWLWALEQKLALQLGVPFVTGISNIATWLEKEYSMKVEDEGALYASKFEDFSPRSTYDVLREANSTFHHREPHLATVKASW